MSAHIVALIDLYHYAQRHVNTEIVTLRRLHRLTDARLQRTASLRQQLALDHIERHIVRKLEELRFIRHGGALCPMQAEHFAGHRRRWLAGEQRPDALLQPQPWPTVSRRRTWYGGRALRADRVPREERVRRRALVERPEAQYANRAEYDVEEEYAAEMLQIEREGDAAAAVEDREAIEVPAEEESARAVRRPFVAFRLVRKIGSRIRHTLI